MTTSWNSHLRYDSAAGAIAASPAARSAPELGGSTSHRSERRFVWQGPRMVQELHDSGLSNYLYSPDSPNTPVARVDAFIGESAAAPSQEAAIVP